MTPEPASVAPQLIRAVVVPAATVWPTHREIGAVTAGGAVSGGGVLATTVTLTVAVSVSDPSLTV